MKRAMISALLLLGCNSHAMDANRATGTIVIDGIASESSWDNAKWQPLDQLLLGAAPSPEDFSGRFKVMWDEKKLFLLVEITDDVLIDTHPNPLELYWDDDCLEIFLDEDNSGGNHQFNYNAFAYHVGLDNQAVDIGENHPDGSVNFLLLNDHLTSAWQRNKQAPYHITWEVAVGVYDDSFKPKTRHSNTGDENHPVTLHAGKKIGFMLAYCDNDGSVERESFIGSTPIKPVNGSKNLGYITSDVFESLLLR